MKTARLKPSSVAKALSVLCDEIVTAEQQSMTARQERREVREALIEWFADRASAPRPTSALLDGSAAERRRRRVERRALSAVVRSLPTMAQISTSDEGEAA